MTPLRLDPYRGVYYRQQIKSLEAHPEFAELDVSIYLAACGFINIFPRYRYGLSVGTLDKTTCASWKGPSFQFIVMRKGGDAYFLSVKQGEFSKEELAQFEEEMTDLRNDRG